MSHGGRGAEVCADRCNSPLVLTLDRYMAMSGLCRYDKTTSAKSDCAENGQLGL